MDELNFKLWDTDVEAREYSGVFEGTSKHIDEGRATGAWMCGYHLNQFFATTEFRDACADFSEQFITDLQAGMSENLKPSIGPVTCTISLWDVDIYTGEFAHRLNMAGHDKSGYHCPTASQLAAVYIMSIIPTVAFADACWDTAREAIKDIEGAVIVNDPQTKAMLG